MTKKGFVHLYTGNGKGKTTAALGQALRAAGAGRKVFIAQFVKGMRYSEIEAIDKYLQNNITTRRYGLECFINRQPTQADIDAARQGLSEVARLLADSDFDMIILDEICIALYFKLIDIDDLLKILNNRRDTIEVILTGRYAPAQLVEFADLVTEMAEIKHYYTSGIESRKGIEF